MRLLIFTSQISAYHNARYVGAKKYFDELYVISSINAGAFPEFLAGFLGEYTVHRLCDGQKQYLAAVASGQLDAYVRDVLKKNQPDAIAVAGWTAPESLSALDYAREKNVPIIVMSESQANDARRSRFREAIKRRVVSQFDAALVGGPSHADYAASLGIPRDRIHYGYNAVDNIHFVSGGDAARASEQQLRGELGLPERYILASARFIKKKNIPNLVYAYAAARGKIIELPELVILGDGPERVAVEKAIDDTGQRANVHLLGFHKYDALPALYSLSEAFVHVSTREQWGLVINEAMASGVPVVASYPCGAARSVIKDGVNGLLTGADVTSISDSIIRLFTMTRQQRREMGAEGRRAISQWGPERFGAGIQAAIDNAMRAPRRGRISPWDRAILAQLRKRHIDAVA